MSPSLGPMSRKKDPSDLGMHMESEVSVISLSPFYRVEQKKVIQVEWIQLVNFL